MSDKTLLFSKPVKKQTLAEQVAETIKEAIVGGDWPPGEALPTEPELAEQFGVSRAVVRDATRMLAAQGLVEAQHGRGVFVTESGAEAFGEALLLALRRAGATVWDVEQFEQAVMPEVVALAAQAADEADLAVIQEAAAAYLETFAELAALDPLPEDGRRRLEAGFRRFYGAIFAATGNALFTLLAPSLLYLRTLRQWEPPEAEMETADIIETETAYVNRLVDAVASADPERARQTARDLMQLPPGAEAAMRETPVGETAVIPAPLPRRQS